MTQQRYTPGPWKVGTGSDLPIGAKGTPRVAIIPLRDVSINEQKANARLIASAPDLLAACEGLLDLVDLVDGSGGNVRIQGKGKAIEDAARAAVAEAKGSKP